MISSEMSKKILYNPDHQAMKTQVIRLETGDDLASIVDKVQFAKTQRILLVWETRKVTLNRQIDLVRLKRSLEAMGYQLAFVLYNPRLARTARDVGIPVFWSIRKAVRSEWARTAPTTTKLKPGTRNIADLRAEGVRVRRSTQAKEISGWARVFWILGGSIVLFIFAILVFPSGEIRIANPPIEQSIRIMVHASDRESAVRLTGYVPAYKNSLVLEGSASRPASGTIKVPDQAASGWVVFTNLQGEKIEIPQGTIVTTRGFHPFRYRLTSDCFLPEGIGNTAKGLIRAVEPGSEGNQLPNSLSLIEGDLSGLILVDNPTPISGGADISKPAPTLADRQALRTALLETLSKQVIEKMRGGLGPDHLTLEPSLRVGKILEESYTPASEIPAEVISLDIKAEFEISYIARKDLEDLATQVLEARLSKEITPIPQTLTINDLSQPVLDDLGGYAWEILATQTVIRVINPEEFPHNLVGIRLPVAQAQLREKLGDVQSASISVAPSWWPWTPLLPFRMHVEVLDHADIGG